MLERTFEKKSSAGKSTNRVMSVGVLTGRPAEEMPGSTGDLLPELSQLHERVRQVMQGVAQALWPSVSMPEGLGELAEKLKGARGASDCGRYRPAVKALGRPGPW